VFSVVESFDEDPSIDEKDLASQPALSRFENAIDVGCLFRLREMLID
jgi:hypothetical protein